MRTNAILCLIIALLLLGILAIVNGKNQEVEVNKQVFEEQIESVEYIRDGVMASYPFIDSGEKNSDKINELILKDFNSILEIYQIDPFLFAPAPEQEIPIILNVSYIIKLNNPIYTSIYYIAAYNNPFAAHPTQLVYTTNIDKAKGVRIVLGEIIKLDMNFVNNFRSWKLQKEEQYPEDVKQAIIEYVSGISNEDLLAGMKTADIIGSGNLLGIYSFLTENSLGISIAVPNYLGDHVEFTMDYNSLKSFINPDFIIADVGRHIFQ